MSETKTQSWYHRLSGSRTFPSYVLIKHDSYGDTPDKDEHHESPRPSRTERLQRKASKIGESIAAGCTAKKCRAALSRLFPVSRMYDGYSALYDLPCDVIAGLTVGIMHIPQGMAYALLTQLPPVYGLYTSFFPVLIYFIFGTSKHISVGTFAVVSLMVGAVVDKGHVAWQRQELRTALTGLEANHTMVPSLTTTMAPIVPISRENLTVWEAIFRQRQLTQLEEIKVGYAMAVTFAVGALQMVLGGLRLGFLTTFLSDPLISGFTTGAAVHVFSSQIKSAFGVKVKRFSGPLKLVFQYKDFFSNLGQANIVTISATLVAIVVLVAIREGINNNKVFKEKMRGIPVPGELMVIIAGTILATHYKIHTEFNVEVIGHIPRGFPTASLSFMQYMPDVIGESFAICFTGFAISFAVAKILADKHGYTVDPNQELVAHGVSNLLGSICSSFCSSASLSRSMVQDQVGGRSQIVSLISSCLVVIVLLALGPYFENLPNSILAAIIIVSLKGLFLQFGELRRLWRVSKVDYTVWLVTFGSTVLLDVDLGLLIGLVYNLVPILLRTQEPYVTLLGQLPDTDVYVDTKVYRNAVPVPGIKIFKFEAPLYFANMDKFRAALLKETGIDVAGLRKLKQQIKETDMTLRHHEVCLACADTWPDAPCEGHGPQSNLTRGLPKGTFAVIIDGSAIQYVDSVTVRVLKEIVLEFREVDIEVYLGECKAPVRAMLDKSGFYMSVYRKNVCATIHHAVQVALKSAIMDRESLASRASLAPEDFLSDAGFDQLELDTSIESCDVMIAEEDSDK